MSERKRLPIQGDGGGERVSVHDAVGGDAFFIDLVEGFYTAVGADPVLRPLYPEDMAESQRTLTGFLIQYWGGSQAYSEERGHPRLRMRHGPFVIGPAERDAWFRLMVASLNRVVADRDVPVEIEQAMREYFEMSAEAMRNSD